MRSLEQTRARWNNLVMGIGVAVGIAPMVVFWMRFFPPLRPFDFPTEGPSWWVAAVCLAACFLPLLLPSGYYRVREFERGRWYPALGVRLFRYLAPDGVLVRRRLREIDRGYSAVKNREELRAHLEGTRATERGHLVWMLAGVFTAAYALRIGEPWFAAALLAGNVVFNVYPVLHQRYKRARVRARRRQ